MWRIWYLFDPRKLLVALTVFLFSLAVLIHFVVFASPNYNIFGGGEMAAIEQPLDIDVIG